MINFENLIKDYFGFNTKKEAKNYISSLSQETKNNLQEYFKNQVKLSFYND